MEFYILERLLYNSNNEFEKDILELVDVCGETKLAGFLENIKLVIESENLLQSIKPRKFHSPDHYENLEDTLNHKLKQITMELTEKCNLRCGYCIYNSSYQETREHGIGEMTEETAKASIDYALKYSDQKDGIAITFYGGEPLLKFPLLKYCVEYSQKTITDRPLTFSVTTNLTLVTPEIAEYLASVEGMSVLCSLDGPKHIHDSYRVDISGQGTFDRAIRGLKYIVDAYGDRTKELVSLSIVFAPPYSYSKLKEIKDFLQGLPWLSKLSNTRITYPVQGDVFDIDENDEFLKRKRLNMKDEVFEQLQGRTLGAWSKNQYLDQLKKNEKIDFFSINAVQESLVRIHQRAIFDKPNDFYTFNACCVPGNRKIYVTVSGDFLICERAPGSPVIGNISTGYDVSKIRSSLIDEYTEASMEYCSNCWALRLCSMCYAYCLKKGSLDIVKKQKYCEMIKNNLVEDLKFYHYCAEVNPVGLEYLGNITSVG